MNHILWKQSNKVICMHWNSYLCYIKVSAAHTEVIVYVASVCVQYVTYQGFKSSQPTWTGCCWLSWAPPARHYFQTSTLKRPSLTWANTKVDKSSKANTPSHHCSSSATAGCVVVVVMVVLVRTAITFLSQCALNIHGHKIIAFHCQWYLTNSLLSYNGHNKYKQIIKSL